MIYPLIGQQCVVVYREQKHIGEVRSVGVNHLGQYRIGVWGFAWGHTVDYPASKVDLLEVKFADGSAYDAREAYQAEYTSENMKAHALAESPPKKETAILPDVAAPKTIREEGPDRMSKLPVTRRINRRR